jgi:hypothetical protein
MLMRNVGKNEVSEAPALVSNVSSRQMGQPNTGQVRCDALGNGASLCDGKPARIVPPIDTDTACPTAPDVAIALGPDRWME